MWLMPAPSAVFVTLSSLSSAFGSERHCRARAGVTQHLQVPVRALLALSPGALLGLRRSTRHPATLVVAGEETFTASVARRGPLRAAQVLSRRVKPDATEERSR